MICDGTVRTREIAWKRRAQNSSIHFPRYVIYYPRRGCFTSTKQNDIKVSIKNCKRLQMATAISGSAAESLVCWRPSFIPSPCPTPPGPGSLWLREAERVAGQAMSPHCCPASHVQTPAAVPPSALSALKNQLNPTASCLRGGAATRASAARCPCSAARGQVGSEVIYPHRNKCLHVVRLRCFFIFASPSFVFLLN